MSRIVVIGAGALGQVFARHLALGGAEITFYVKPKHERTTRAGFTLWRLHLLGAPERHRFEGFEVVTSLEEVAAAEPEEIWLAVPTGAIMGPFLEELVEVMGEATLVVLQPGIEQRDRVLSICRSARVVFGVPSIVSYPAPLGDEDIEGTAYYLPPLGPSAFSGPPEEVGRIVRRLKAGGMSARRVGDAVWAGAVPTAVLITHVAALELAGWSFRAAARSPHLQTAARAAREAIVVAARHMRRRAPLVRHLVRTWLLKPAMWLGKRVAPFDVEAYLELHFRKTGAQTRLLLESIVEVGEREGAEIESVRALRASLGDEA